MFGKRKAAVAVIAGEETARYGFGQGHPFGPDRQDAFLRGMKERELEGKVRLIAPGTRASRWDVELFHSPRYVSLVEEMSGLGEGFLDFGDTPAFRGIYEAALSVVGAALQAGEMVMAGEAKRAFVPIGGLHHAARMHASGFCVFNDCGVLIEALRRRHGLKRVAYVDIDAHHGDGVFYGFLDDPDALFADIHEDGRFLFPGTGAREETGEGPAAGTKLNLPVHPGARDDDFFAAWREVEAYLEEHRPEFILLQCGADSLAGDPITHLRYSEEAHGHAAAALCEIADRHAGGRLVAFGGGGYNRRNLSDAWSRVVQELVAHS